MSRKNNINQRRRLPDTGSDDDGSDEIESYDLSAAVLRYPIPSTAATCSTALLVPPTTRREPGGRNAASEQTVHPVVRTVEEIVSKLMWVVDKKERCWDIDLQYWLTTYETIRREASFPVKAMLVGYAASIYGRRVDYLGDMVMYMNEYQKSREQQLSAEANKTSEDAAQSSSTTRKRAGRFKPQSGSDCVDDVEFTCSDAKLLKLDALIKPPIVVEVDHRTKYQQMQELCTELRAHPTRQRRQEILNRLRDEASILPMLSSHGVVRNNQILDLESGETIGTRYDYQIHQNYIDGRTGALIAEHDLKRFFQRCDVMDLVSEQLEAERDRCTRLGMLPPADMLSVKAREVKIFMPPEYLKDRYRISVNDTTDFDNALMQARITNYNSDPILTLMDAAERERRCKQFEEDEAAGLIEANDSGYRHDSQLADDPSFSNVLCSSRVNESTGDTGESHNSTANPSQTTLETSDENPLESELMVLESDASQTKNDEDKPTGAASRLSVDEGIGVDRESPPRSSSTTQEIGASVAFTGGTIIPRQTVQRSANRLQINLFGLPEKMTTKKCIFSLPGEYRTMKTNLVKRGGVRTADTLRVGLYNLHPLAPRNPLLVERPSTPDLEDFLGFNDEEAPDVCHPVAKHSNKSHQSEEPPADRPSTPDCDFEGFTEEEVTAGDRQSLRLMPKEVAKLSSTTRSPKRQQTGDGTSSLPVTPSRLSCDSGISESAERGKDTGSHSEQEPLMSEPDDEFDSGLAALDAHERQPLKEHTEASNARIQERNDEVKERIQKVNAWHKKLKPILNESEKRNHFDIHEYGTEIIDTFDKATAAQNDGSTADLQRPTITLASVLQDKPAHSTARYFLSMLMLANTNNVEIVNKNRDPLRLSSTSEIELRLISRKRHHQEMEALGELLPSESDPDRGQRKRQNRKRKRVIGSDHGTPEETVVQEEAEPCVLVDPALVERLLSPVDEPNFIDNVRQLYPELNSEESKRKRMAFRRGLRNYAYGLEEGSGEHQAPEPPPKTPPPAPQCNVQPFPSPEEDDILQVDLLTNNATLISAREAGDMCGRSIFSLVESGYESMINEGNNGR